MREGLKTYPVLTGLLLSQHSLLVLTGDLRGHRQLISRLRNRRLLVHGDRHHGA